MLFQALISLILVTSNTLIVRSDPSITTVQYPLYSHAIIQNNYSIAYGYIDSGANWIWSNGSTTSATFETLFYSYQAGSA